MYHVSRINFGEVDKSLWKFLCHDNDSTFHRLRDNVESLSGSLIWKATFETGKLYEVKLYCLTASII